MQYYEAPRRPIPPKPSRRSYSILALRLSLIGLLCAAAFFLGKSLGASRPVCTPLPLQSAQLSLSVRPADTAAVTASVPVETRGIARPWNLVLVNFENPLSADFTPELVGLRNDQAVDSRILPDLQAMMDAARAAGLQPLICSSFRSYQRQSELFEGKKTEYLVQGCSLQQAEEKAALWVSRPGRSEHQTGLAVDIVAMDYQLLDEAQENQPESRWLHEHCWEYGFILRYPREKKALTGIEYEPWHYRYVGREAAAAIQRAGVCLEEYLASLPAQ